MPATGRCFSAGGGDRPERRLLHLPLRVVDAQAVGGGLWDLPPPVVNCAARPPARDPEDLSDSFDGRGEKSQAPSADQDGVWTSCWPVSSRCGTPPSEPSRYASNCPRAFESKAMKSPSGDQRGDPTSGPPYDVTAPGSRWSQGVARPDLGGPRTIRLEGDPASVRRKRRATVVPGRGEEGLGWAGSALASRGMRQRLTRATPWTYARRRPSRDTAAPRHRGRRAVSPPRRPPRDIA